MGSALLFTLDWTGLSVSILFLYLYLPVGIEECMIWLSHWIGLFVSVMRMLWVHSVPSNVTVFYCS